MKKKKRNRKRKCIEVLIYSNTVMQHITVLSEIELKTTHIYYLTAFVGHDSLFQAPRGQRSKCWPVFRFISGSDWARTCFKLRWLLAEISVLGGQLFWDLQFLAISRCHLQFCCCWPKATLSSLPCRLLPIQTLFHQCYWDGHYSTCIVKLLKWQTVTFAMFCWLEAKYRTHPQ